MYENIRQYPEAMRLCLQWSSPVFGVEEMLDLFIEPILADVGSNLRAKQIKSLLWWRDLVVDMGGRHG